MRIVLPVVVLLALAAGGAGCVRVQPYQRGLLSARVMQADSDPMERKLDDHVFENREGSIGGSGVAGGGCGCN